MYKVESMFKKVQRTEVRFLTLIGPIFLLNLGFYLFAVPPTDIGDSIAVIDSASKLNICLSSGSVSCPGLAHFGFGIVFLPFILIFLGFSQSTIIAIMSFSSLASYAFIILTLIKFKKAFGLYGEVVIWSFLVGLPLAYSRSTFSEELSLFLLTSMLFAYLNKSRLVFLLSCLFFSMTRESAIFLSSLLLMSFLFGLQIHRDLQTRKSMLMFGTGGVILGALITFCFNLYRWGTFGNPVYGNSDYFIFDIFTNFSSLFGLIFSPSGGILFFWPMALIIIPTFYSVFQRGFRLRAVSILAPLMLIFVTCSFWFSPFGWIAWGPRLVFPILGIVLLQIIIFWHQSGKKNEVKHVHSWLILLFILQLISTLISFSRHFANNNFFGAFFNSGICPPITIENSPKGEIAECLRKMTWEVSDSIFSRGFESLFQYQSGGMGFFLMLYFAFSTFASYRIAVSLKKEL